MPIVSYGTKCWVMILVLSVHDVSAAAEIDLPLSPISTDQTLFAKSATTGISLPTAFIHSKASHGLNLGQLESIQAETVLYEAQLARAKALNELQKNGYDHSLDHSFNPIQPAQKNRKSEVKATTSDFAPPLVIEIVGNGKGYTALLSLSNGNQHSVQAGTRIPGTDYTVKNINLNEVVVTGPEESSISLSFAG